MLTHEAIKLTSLSGSAGCAAKLSPSLLSDLLAPFQSATLPELMVGLQTSDDAAVYRLSPDQAVVQTIDFFTPIVDDPYTFGAIAAANAMSDIYAMGGDVSFALNVVAFPIDLDPAILAAILAGGADKVMEAGGVIAGGHSIADREPKYGLSVTGFVHPDHVWRKAGARPGDVLYITKALGTGILTTALKNGAATDEMLSPAVRSMTTLNKSASLAARGLPINACTDVTGFGLTGHTFEVADRSGVRIVIEAGALPLLPGALELAGAGHTAGGLHRNRAHFERAGVSVNESIDPALGLILFDPQTSGGLLFSISAAESSTFEHRFHERDLPLWKVGRVESGRGVAVIP
jgi:selenide,water dikinase